jgi:CheY-like chemotaxis protein
MVDTKSNQELLILILIVEDVPAMQGLLTHLLKEVSKLGVSNRVLGAAATVPEARILLSKNVPDLVLLDLVLPGESGHALFSDFNDLKIPFWVLRADDEPAPVSLTELIQAQGGLGFVQKPAWETLDSDILRFAQALRKVGRVRN